MIKSLKLIGTLMILFMFCVGLTACGISSKDLEPLDPNSTEIVLVDIPSGSTPKTIGTILEEKKIIGKSEAFVSMVKTENVASKLKAGQYQLSASMPMSEIVRRIATGEVFVDKVKVVIPEGFEVKQIIERLVTAGLGSEEEFTQELKTGTFEYPFLQGINRETLLEGFLFPATYQFDKQASPHEVIDAMLSAFNKNFSSEFFERSKTLNLSVSDIVTLASIIEREAQVGDERAIVSSVFHNRLKINMMLQSCATVQYALGERKEVLTFKDLKVRSPYNTYAHRGLPPAPIASPGLESLKAALYPAETEYLYFVTTNNGDGSHYFSKTLEEHNAAIKKSKK